jgi:hypothetical protein
MIDVSELSYQEIQNLKKQIEEYDNSKKGLRGYKVQFIVLYNPKGRVGQDISDEESFADWLSDVVSDNITKSFGFKQPEDVILDHVMELDDGEIADLIQEQL